jgi:predicted DNA-binding protein (MmcQ/YjbR family)
MPQKKFSDNSKKNIFMVLKEFKKYCKSFIGVTEEYPFDETTLVYKIKGKMFTLTDINTFNMISVKCDPDDAQIIRQMFESVIPGYHLNKEHWNSIKIDGRIPDTLLKEWIEDSYNLVVQSLPKKIQKELKRD